MAVCFLSPFLWTIGFLFLNQTSSICYCSTRRPAEVLGFACVWDKHTNPGGIRTERLGEMSFRWLLFSFLIPKSEPLFWYFWPTNQEFSLYYDGFFGGLLGWDRLFREKFRLQVMYHLDHWVAANAVYQMYLDLCNLYKSWTRKWMHQCLILLIGWSHLHRRSTLYWRISTLWSALLLCMKGMMLLDLGMVFGFKTTTAKSWLHHLWKQGRQNDHSVLHWLIFWIEFVYKRKAWQAGFLLQIYTAGNWLSFIITWFGKNFDLWSLNRLIIVWSFCYRALLYWTCTVYFHTLKVSGLDT
ncbi:hypothetical protein Hanom_Chr17g01589361 [Helianthus anomalus]